MTTTDPSATITDTHRATLALLADVLIPASDTMPAASEVGVAGELLDGVLAVRDDLTAALVGVLDAADAADPEGTISRVRQSDPAGFDVLTFVVAGGYLMDRSVGEILGYPGQEEKQVDPYDYMAVVEDGLLDPVIERGAIYRPTPGTTS